jgi:hypothetical protein
MPARRELDLVREREAGFDLAVAVDMVQQQSPCALWLLLRSSSRFIRSWQKPVVLASLAVSLSGSKNPPIGQLYRDEPYHRPSWDGSVQQSYISLDRNVKPRQARAAPKHARQRRDTLLPLI